jgi:hypothetical protein
MRIRRWWAYLWRMTLWLIRFILFTLQMEDNHLWKLRDNSYDKEQYYDEWYDQTEETKSDLFDILDRKEKEVNIDNFYNELLDD